MGVAGDTDELVKVSVRMEEVRTVKVVWRVEVWVVVGGRLNSGVEDD